MVMPICWGRKPELGWNYFSKVSAILAGLVLLCHSFPGRHCISLPNPPEVSSCLSHKTGHTVGA